MISALLCGAAFYGLNSAAARAGIIITAPTMTLPYSATDQTATAEVFVQDTDSASPQIGADEVELALPDSPDIYFTGAAATVGHPYIFGSQTPGFRADGDVLYGTDFSGDTVPVLADGDGLLMIQITVKGGTIGDFPLTFATDIASDPLATMLYDQWNSPIAFTVEGGAIDVGPSPVPEPSSIALTLIAILAAAIVACRRRMRGAMALAASRQ